MLETLFAVPGRERRDCAALCNFRHLSEVEGRGLYADPMALVGLLNPRNQGRGWMQLCASCQDCACIGIHGIASERSSLAPRMSPTLRPSLSVCAYQVTNIYPCGRSARTRHLSRHRARFSHGWATNRPCSSGRYEGETRAKASATTSLGVSAERSPPRQAYRETLMRVQPRACTSGCTFGQSA